MNQELKKLFDAYESKLILAWQYDTELGVFDECETFPRRRLDKARKLMEEADIARLQFTMALDQLETQSSRLSEKISELSWIKNPDRSGGQFTQEEIDRSTTRC